MWSNEYVIYGYNKDGKVIMRLNARTLDGIRTAIGEMYLTDTVKRISIQAFGEEPMRNKEDVDIDEKIDSLIDQLKITNRELSNIVTTLGVMHYHRN